jgi:hypothetical protein
MARLLARPRGRMEFMWEDGGHMVGEGPGNQPRNKHAQDTRKGPESKDQAAFGVPAAGKGRKVLKVVRIDQLGSY